MSDDPDPLDPVTFIVAFAIVVRIVDAFICGAIARRGRRRAERHIPRAQVRR